MHGYNQYYYIMSRNIRKLQLPANFAEKLLDCEIEYKLSDKPSKQLVRSLIQFYTMGVEYYQSIRSHKYLYFQQKMMEIFTSSTTISSINQDSAKQISSPLKKRMKSGLQQQKIQAIQIKQKQQKLLKQIAASSDQSVNSSIVKQLINENDLKNISVNEKVSKQLKNQDEKLKIKIQKRKSRASLTKSFSSAAGFTENETQDSLFKEILSTGSKQQMLQIKPIKVSFDEVIKENESDKDEQETPKNKQKVKNSMSSNELVNMNNF